MSNLPSQVVFLILDIHMASNIHQCHELPLFPPTTRTKLAKRRSHWRSKVCVLCVTLSPSLRRSSVLSARFRPGHPKPGFVSTAIVLSHFASRHRYKTYNRSTLGYISTFPQHLPRPLIRAPYKQTDHHVAPEQRRQRCEQRQENHVA